MGSLRVALSTGCFYKLDIFDVLPSIKKAGFDLVEICSSPRHLDPHDLDRVRKAAEALAELDMKAMSFHAPFAENIDITSQDEERRRYSASEILKAADAARALKVQNLVLHPGPEKKQGPPVEELFERMRRSAEFMRELALVCGRSNTQLLLENMLPHLIFGHVRDIMWILGSVKAENMGICLDTGHANIGGGLEFITGKLSGHLKMLHANDNNGANDEHLPPGSGTIDWPRFVSELKKARFSGGVVLELSGETDSGITDVLDGAVRAKELLKDLWRRGEV